MPGHSTQAEVSLQQSMFDEQANFVDASPKGILQNSGLPLLMLRIMLGSPVASMLARRMATSVGDPLAFRVSRRCLEPPTGVDFRC